MDQTYQEVSEEVLEALPVETIEVKVIKKGIDIQQYFYELKKKDPKRFERLRFDTNGHKPFCLDLEDIIGNLTTFIKILHEEKCENIIF